jgi:steroid 5-alpha reductase family enzyme
MEWPAVFVFSAIFFMAPERQVVHWIFYLTWMTHYAYRTLIYPFRLSRSARPFPWIIVFLGFVFQMINAPLCGYDVFWLRQDYGLAWLGDIRLFVGIGLFGLGFWMNQSADQTLINIRKKFPGEYKIPEGGMYRWISCPNYLGEILEWTGWAVMTWSVSGLAFSVWTIANLAPRALSHHKWYKKKFAEYPKSRKALVPGVI